MSNFRDNLPQMDPLTFLTDGGLETDLIFNKGVDLPDFAAFVLLAEERGRGVLAEYYREYLELARSAQTGLVLESPTWRANPDWAESLGYNSEQLVSVNNDAISMMASLRDESELDTPVVLSGCVGPRSDGYQPKLLMSAEQAHRYHQLQINAFADSEADFVTAITMGYSEEAIGIALAAREAGIPVVLSFTTETDGRLPSGSTLAEAISMVDEATEGYPAYYMINCAHPDHFGQKLDSDAYWTKRVWGVRSNASRASHAELDEAPVLDAGDPREFGSLHAGLLQVAPQLKVFGGCCGTDIRHVREIAASLTESG